MSNYERLFAHSADAMCELDNDGRILRSNDAAKRLLGKALACAHVTIADLFDATYHDSVASLLKSFARGKVAGVVEGRIAGTQSWTSWQLTRTNEQQILALGRDVSIHHETASALDQKTAFLQSIIEAQPECVKLVAPDGCLLDMNQAGLRMVGATKREDAIGKSVHDLIAPEDRERFLAFHERVCSGIGGSLSFDTIGLDGNRRSMETTAVPLPKTPGGELLHLAITRDMTERQILERQLVHSQKMEAIGQLAGGMAHDFNNLLTAIIGPAELALMTVPNDSDVARDLEQIRATGERAARLTKKLLTFARRHVVQLEPLSLRDLIENLRDMLERLLGETISLHIDISKTTPLVLADRGHIEQVLLNLAVNARDASGLGGEIQITVREESIDDDRAARLNCPSGRYVAIRVIDHGGGIHPQHLPNIFDPFFTTKAIGAGTGLGLSTCRSIVEELHGAIDVQSELGKGTTFCVLIPALKEGVAIIERPSTIRRGQQELILLVEDDAMVRDAVTRMLVAAGYRVHACGDAQLALDECHKLDRVDLLISDMTMPGMGGVELAERLRVLRPELRVLLMTGYLQSPNEATDHGGDHERTTAEATILQKPFSNHALSEAVDVALHGLKSPK